MFQSETLKIVPLTSNHANDFHHLIQSNLKTFEGYLPITVVNTKTLKLSHQLIKKKLESARKKREFLFVLKEVHSDKLIGFVLLKKIDWTLKQGEFAYGISAAASGKGFMSQAISFLSRYAFDYLGIHQLQIITHKTNLGSVQVAMKSGFSWVKTLEAEFTNSLGIPLDMELFELSK